MFISQAYAAETAGPAAGSGYSSIIMLVLFGLVFYFLLIRPQTKRQKEHKAFIVLNVGDKVEMKFQRHSITATLPKGTIKAVNEE